MSIDSLIPAEERAKIEKDQARAAARAERARSLAPSREPEPEVPVEGDSVYHNDPYESGYTRWPEVAELLVQRAREHPGAWTRLRANARTRRMAEDIRWGGINALSGLDVEAFARHARPRSDGEPVGWEIYARLVPGSVNL